MEQFKIDDSPITYYVSGRERDEWVIFLHATFVDHQMFRVQRKYGHTTNI